MKTIAYLVNTFLRPSEGFIYDQIAQINNFKVEVFTRRYANRHSFPVTNISSFDSASRFSYWRDFLFYTLLRRSKFFEERIKQKNISLLHAHFGVDAIYAIPLKKRFELPLIVTFHGQDITRLPHFTLYPPAWLNYWLHFDALKVEGDLFLAVSDYIRGKLIEKGFPPGKVKTHYLGINTDVEPGGRDREKAVLTVGRLVEKKGTEFLVRAFGEIAGKDPDIKLWVCGEGPLKPRLQLLAEELKLQERVLFLGWKSKNEVFALMKKCRVFSLPSVTASDGDAEGLGIAILEAMAHGLPVIGTRHGGIPEIVRDGDNGFLVPEKDSHALADRILRLVADEKLARDMGARSREIATREFDIKKQIVALETIYEEYLRRHEAKATTAKKPLVSIITSDFSHNCVGRAYLIADLLKRDFRVEIVGPAFKNDVWNPIKNRPENIEYKYLPMNKKQLLSMKTVEITGQVSGDVIIISKCVFPSLFIGLMAKMRRSVPLIIDIDDWELGFEIDRFQKAEHLGKKALSLLWMGKLLLCEMTARLIRKRIVSNSFLGHRFSGEMLPHVRDTDYFDPAKYSGRQMRKALGIPENARVVLFLGTPREHKGVKDLFSAFKRLKAPGAILAVVGFNPASPAQMRFKEEIGSALGERCRLYDQQPFDKIPGFLSMADIVVVPQKDCYSSMGQIPAKLFDAMAMAKPVIASRVNDIPAILQHCGMLYEAGNIGELAGLLEKLLNDPAEIARMGKKAREMCVMKYSYAAVKESLSALVTKTLAGERQMR